MTHRALRVIAFATFLICWLGCHVARAASTLPPPANAPFVCWYPGDYADMRGQGMICWWEPDAPPSGYWPASWSDSLGRRVDWCTGNPAQGDVDIISNAGNCTRVHGIAASTAAPMGFWFDWDYVITAGWYGLAPDTWWQEVEISQYRAGPNTHVMFCDSSLTGSVSAPCQTMQHYVYSTIGVSAGTMQFVVHGFTVATSSPTPAACPRAAQKWVSCPGKSPCGLPVVMGGDGLPRGGGYAVIGNPLIGSDGYPCLGVDQQGKPAVLVYPLQGAPVTNPDGTTSFTPVCPS